MPYIPNDHQTFNTSFIVMPNQTNYMLPLIFGGAFMSQLDLAAASLVHRCVAYSKDCDNAVTHKASFEFLAPANMGDLILMEATLTEAKGKHLCIEVRATKELRNTMERSLVAVAQFVFVTRDKEEYKRHNLTME